MAGNRATISTEIEIQSGTAAKTILQIAAPSTVRLKVKEISVAFKGTTQGNAPVLVEVLRQSTAGTGGTTVNPKKLSPNSDTLTAVGLRGPTSAVWTAEPTSAGSDTPVMIEEVHPQTGYTWQAPHGGEIEIPQSGRLAVRVTATVDVATTARIVFEE